MIYAEKLQKFQHYHQEMLVNINFQPVKMTYQKHLWKKLLQSKDLNIIH